MPVLPAAPAARPHAVPRGRWSRVRRRAQPARPQPAANLPPAKLRPGSAADGPLELLLGHLRAALDVLLAGLLVQLVPRPPARSPVRTQATPPARGDVLGRRWAGLPRLAAAGPLLVHRPGGDLLGLVLGAASVLEPLLDVFVLPLPLVAPCSPRHSSSLLDLSRRGHVFLSWCPCPIGRRGETVRFRNVERAGTEI